VFARVARERGPLRARLWYRCEAVAFATRFLIERSRITRMTAPSGPLPIAWLPVPWLDIKLGFRMLVKYPGLTTVGCMALAIGVGVAVGVSSLVHDVMNPTLDLPYADRVITIVNVDVETSSQEDRILHDFVEWREELDAVEVLAAFRSTTRNVTGDVGGGEPVRTAVLNASAFEIAGERPVLGRTLVESDERPDAPRVAVIGHATWTARFAADPDVIGRVIQVDGEPVTVVGVMPEGFRFPSAYELWEPFRYNPLDYDRGEGPSLRLIGRLQPGVPLESAQAEVDAMGRRAAAAYPQTHARLRPRVMPYVRQFTDPDEILLAYGIQTSLAFLLLIVCANVGLLILARTLARAGELAIRNAMGASRRRIIGQLFVETLVLSSVAAGLGLFLAGRGITGFAAMSPTMPFWIQPGLDTGDFLFAGLLVLASAFVAGVVPGLRATGRGLAAELQRTSGGIAGRGFGAGSHTLVVTQVFFSVCLLAGAVAIAEATARFRPETIDLPVDEYFMARLRLDPEVPAGQEAEAYRSELARRVADIQQEVERRVLDEPGVVSVTFASSPPFTDHAARFMEVDGDPSAGFQDVVVRGTEVAPTFFDAFDAVLIGGRGFVSSDVEEGNAIVVTEAFARRMLGGRDPIGERVRYVNRAGAPVTGDWHQVVGVVTDMWTLPDPLGGERDPVVYHPLRPGEVSTFGVVARAPNAPGALPGRLRVIALEVEPTLMVTSVGGMRDHFDEEQREVTLILWAVTAGFAAVLALSLAGIYAIVSFTVTQRRREIGIRTALGSQRWRIARTLVSRVMVDVAIGVALAWGLLAAIPGIEGMDFRYLPAVVATVVLTGLATCLVPTARGMKIRPADALRAEG
jgi:predicted permease